MDNLVTITDRALAQLRIALQDEHDINVGIRIGIRGGGCSGYQWVLDVEDNPSDMDLHFDYDGVKVYIDPMSAPFVKGTNLDYLESLMASGFSFTNESIKKECGCGKSVSF